MSRRWIAAAVSALFLAAVSSPAAIAQTAQTPAAKPAPKARATKPKEPKKLTAQQQKMKDCAAKWNDHKKSTGAKGRKAYNEFMKPCLKGTTT